MLNYNSRYKKLLAFMLCIIIALTFVNCKEKKLDRGETISPIKKEEGDTKMAIKITSTAFAEGEMIPKKYSCDGEGVSPVLKWENIPEDAKSLVLISDDPDAPAGTWVHWVVYDMSPNINELPEDIPPVELLEDIEGLNLAGKQGINSAHKIGYYPPCPPSGTHRYFFKVYALDTMLNLKSGASKKEIVRAMEGHITAQGQLMGKYKR
ncbi:MAG: YbhB/YbcL family Raf kinase inhibitor-like protein [Candidatus Cloacimonadota bacterium]|nr:YbhB/YbcL family Raf kinase inhibitor-like protein [Candidatus Cloacimonadota bacterium]